MSTENELLPNRRNTLDPDQLDWIDTRVKRFEEEWRADVESDFEVYLADAGSLRVPLLAELAHADIEFLHRSGRPSSLEKILSRFQELARNSGAVAELLWAEYQFRKQTDPQLNVSTLAELLPNLCRQLGDKFGENSISIRKSTVANLTGDRNNALHDPPNIPGFEVREMLGRGGVGVVYRALDLQLNRDVAIKLLLNGSLASADEQSRFRREAATVAALQHPQIVQVFQVGIHERQPYLVLEYASQGNLSKKLGGKPVPQRTAAEIMVGIARATDAIHRCGILHRDLKPSNVLVTDQGTLKIADFGLAKLLSAEATQTLGDSIVGTPSYSAPEYLFGVADRESPSMDIYSLGAILYELLTGRAPFIGNSIYDILVKLKQGDYLPPSKLVSGISEDLENICTKCLDRSPQCRYATAAELADDLERFLEGRTVLARPLSMPVRSWRWIRRNPWITASAATFLTLMLLVVSGALGFVWLQSRSIKIESELRVKADRLRDEAVKSEQQARSEAATANEAVQLVEKLLESSSLGLSSNEFSQSFPARHTIDMSAREMVVRNIKLLQDSPIKQPMVRARLLTAVGTSALNIGMVKESRSLATEALAIYEKFDALNSMSAANACLTLARVEAQQWNIDAATDLFQKTRSILKSLDSGESDLWADTIIYQAWMDVSMHKKDYAADVLPSLEQATELKCRLQGKEHVQSVLAKTVLSLCRALVHGDRQTSIVELEGILTEIRVRPIHPYFEALVLDQLASIHQRHNNTEMATNYVSQSLALMQRAFGNTPHPDLGMVYADAAWIAHCRGDEVSFRKHQVEAISIRKQLVDWDKNNMGLVGELFAGLESAAEWSELSRWLRTIENDIPDIELDFRNLAYFLSRIEELESRGEYEKALIIVDRCVALWAEFPPSWTPTKERLTLKKAQLLTLRGEYASAASVYRSWLQNRLPPPELSALNQVYLSEWSDLADLIGERDRPETMSLREESSIDLYVGRPLIFHQDEWGAMIELFFRTAKQTDGRKRLEEWHDDWIRNRSPAHVCMGGLKAALAVCYLEEAELDRASQFANEAHQLLKDCMGEHAGWTIDSQMTLARIHVALQDFDKAESLAKDAITRTSIACGEDHPRTQSIRRQVARLLFSINRRYEANEIAMDSFKVSRERLGVHHSDYADSVFLVVEFLAAGENPNAVSEFLNPIVEEYRQSVPPKNQNRLRMERLLEEKR